jgi:hypothetical protein
MQLEGRKWQTQFEEQIDPEKSEFNRLSNLRL